MRKLLYTISAALIIGCVLAMSLSCAMFQPRGNAGAEVVITPSQGTPTTKVAIIGSGFKPEEEIDIVMMLGDGLRIGMGTRKVEMVIADSKGGFSVTSAVPKMAKPGLYAVEVEGNKGSKVAASVEVVKKR